MDTQNRTNAYAAAVIVILALIALHAVSVSFSGSVQF